MKLRSAIMGGWAILIAAQAHAGPPPGPNSLGPDWAPQQDEARDAVRRGRYIPLGRVLEEIRRRTPGVQLDAGLEQWNGRAVYRVRWAAVGGRRIDYIVDAGSGAILSAQGD